MTAIATFFTLFFISTSAFSYKVCPIPESKRSLTVKYYTKPALHKKCRRKGVFLGAPVYIRIIKQSRELELWMKRGHTYKLFKTYKIRGMSGRLGPKLRHGDKQAPEGCYTASANSLNPRSQFHLAVNVGYPNQLDRSYGCTGNLIMIHGGVLSRGCFAMTDKNIEEIYTLISEAFKYGQKKLPIHIFPFHMTNTKMKRHHNSSCIGFWRRLQPIYQQFQKTKIPPKVAVRNRSYIMVSQRAQ